MHRLNFSTFGQSATALAFWLILAGCGTNIPATYVAPPTAPGTGTNPPLPPQVAPAPVSRVFIENKRIRLGIDLKMGGAIVYLAEIGGENLVNNRDYGRQIQTSLYSGPAPYSVNGKNPPSELRTLGWNPVQSGDFYNNTSRVVDYRQDSTHFYVKTIPLHWPLYNEPAECIMEHWIDLKDNVVQVRSRSVLSRSDTTQYRGQPQENPAVYLNAPYSRIVFYEGDQPFTNSAPAEPRIDNTAEVRTATENWVAMLNGKGRGIGLFQAGQPRYNVGFFGTPGTGGEFSLPTGYLAGTAFALLDHNAVHEFQYSLILGTLSDIRQFVYNQPRPAQIPNFRFASDRQQWYYQNTTDTGLPIRGELNVRFDGDRDLQLFSPMGFWRGRDVPKLYLQAAFKTSAQTARLSWRRHGDQAPLPLPDRYIDFPIIGDGQYRTYELDMNQSAGWRDNAIIQIFLSPTVQDTARLGRSVRIRSLTTTP